MAFDKGILPDAGTACCIQHRLDSCHCEPGTCLADGDIYICKQRVRRWSRGRDRPRTVMAVTWTMMALLDLGLVFELFPMVYIGVKFLGGLYLLYLACNNVEERIRPINARIPSARHTFRQGFDDQRGAHIISAIEDTSYGVPLADLRRQ